MYNVRIQVLSYSLIIKLGSLDGVHNCSSSLHFSYLCIFLRLRLESVFVLLKSLQNLAPNNVFNHYYDFLYDFLSY